jgi:hypothetical protein
MKKQRQRMSKKTEKSDDGPFVMGLCVIYHKKYAKKSHEQNQT